MYHKDFIPDLLTHDGPFTGQYSISYVVMQLKAILMTWAVFEVKLTGKTRVD
jgi:hypothetical protein